MTEKFYKLDDLMQMFGVTRAWIYSWVYHKRIPFVRLGRLTLRFREADIKKWIAEKTTLPTCQQNQEKTKKLYKRTNSKIKTEADRLLLETQAELKR